MFILGISFNFLKEFHENKLLIWICCVNSGNFVFCNRYEIVFDNNQERWTKAFQEVLRRVCHEYKIRKPACWVGVGMEEAQRFVLRTVDSESGKGNKWMTKWRQYQRDRQFIGAHLRQHFSKKLGDLAVDFKSIGGDQLWGAVCSREMLEIWEQGFSARQPLKGVEPSMNALLRLLCRVKNIAPTILLNQRFGMLWRDIRGYRWSFCHGIEVVWDRSLQTLAPFPPKVRAGLESYQLDALAVSKTGPLDCCYLWVREAEAPELELMCASFLKEGGAVMTIFPSECGVKEVEACIAVGLAFR